VFYVGKGTRSRAFEMSAGRRSKHHQRIVAKHGKAANRKQGQEDNLDQPTQEWFRRVLDSQCRLSYDLYQEALERGVAAEHARTLLHLNHYTHWLWKQDLHNMMNFLRLRDHSHAQIEAQRYAQAVDQLLRQYLPNSMALYDKYRRRLGGIA
jgi:thymidylate synthase (FAD)